MQRVFFLIVAATILGGCDDGGGGGADGGPGDGGEEPITAEVTVMTWNLYMGTDIDPLMNPDSIFEVPALVADAWAQVQANDFEARAEVIADIIADDAPHLIALQEVSLYRGQSPGDFMDGNDVASEEVWLDYLEVLAAALLARDLDYELAVVGDGVDVEVPMAGDGELDDLRLTDRDAILVRGDVPFTNAEAHTFENVYVAPVSGSDPIVVDRGWVTVEATVEGVVLRFAGTHLEIPGASASIQVAQGDEVIAAFADAPEPVFVVGDLNSPATGAGTATYGNFLDAGYVDAWDGAGNTENGFTCCYGADLVDTGYVPGSRIDFVLSRGDVTYSEVHTIGSGVLAEGDLHPSDHLGVVATFEITQ
jgi:endonuclease/exonuclease/phosphatase family metal-dependent hydrolase